MLEDAEIHALNLCKASLIWRLRNLVLKKQAPVEIANSAGAF